MQLVMKHVVQGVQACDASTSSHVIKCPIQSFKIDCDGTAVTISELQLQLLTLESQPVTILKTESSNKGSFVNWNRTLMNMSIINAPLPFQLIVNL